MGNVVSFKRESLRRKHPRRDGEADAAEALRAQAERTAERLVGELVDAFGQRGAAVYLQLLTNNVARIRQ